MPNYLNKTSGAVAANDTSVTLAWRETSPGFVAVQLAGTFSGTITFEATVDGANWVAINGMPVASTTPASTATAAGIWYITANGVTAVRARSTTWASGSLTATLVGMAN